MLGRREGVRVRPTRVLDLVAAQVELQFRQGQQPWRIWGFNDGLRGRHPNPPHSSQFETKRQATGAHRRYMNGHLEGTETRRRRL